MERFLRRQLHRAVQHASGDTIELTLVLPAAVTAGAPHWHPGPGFQTCIDYRSWCRDDGRLGTITAVVADVPPKFYPAWHGGHWTEPEVWTVQLPPGHYLIGDLWDKPHRVTWLLEPADPEGIEPNGTILKREPLAGHPSQAPLLYWDNFWDQYGFQPQYNYLIGAYIDPIVWDYRDYPSVPQMAHHLARRIRRLGGHCRLLLAPPA